MVVSGVVMIPSLVLPLYEALSKSVQPHMELSPLHEALAKTGYPYVTIPLSIQGVVIALVMVVVLAMVVVSVMVVVVGAVLVS